MNPPGVATPPGILLEIIGPVAVVSLNRPEKRNAINPAMATALGSMIDQIESDPRIRVGVLRANMAKGRPVFCAGHDLTHFRESFGTDEEDAVTNTDRRLRRPNRRGAKRTWRLTT